MSRRCAIVMFVDACGWEVLRSRPSFLQNLPHHQRAASLFGFSSACVPAILTGQLPASNDHWSSFFFAPSTSPFKILRVLKVLPSSLFDRGRVRRYLSRLIALIYRYTGYFQIYNLPFEALPLFDYAEKQDIFRPRGINRGTSIFDDLEAQRIPHHVSNWRRSEEVNIASLQDALAKEWPRFAFLYTAKLDALMHDHTKDSPLVDEKLRWYEGEIQRVLMTARNHYDEVRFALVSDHGMASVHQVVNLIPRVEALGLRFGVDYAAVYDSTMLRFWFFSPPAEASIRAVLPDDACGWWVDEAQLKAWGTWWADNKFGHAVYALQPGLLLNPSHMGRVAPAGMHGYRPDHPDSDAALIASFTPSSQIASITDFYSLMKEMASWAMAG